MTNSWLFLKKFQTGLLFFSESTLLLLADWVVLRSKQSMFQRIFLKKIQFIVISDEKRQFSKHHFSQSRVSRVSLQTESSNSIVQKKSIKFFCIMVKKNNFLKMIHLYIQIFFGLPKVQRAPDITCGLQSAQSLTKILFYQVFFLYFTFVIGREN